MSGVMERDYFQELMGCRPCSSIFRDAFNAALGLKLGGYAGCVADETCPAMCISYS